MKSFLLISLLAVSAAAFAQPKLVNSAVISTLTNVIAPDDDDVSQIQNQGGGFNFRNFADGETKSVTYIKGDSVKTTFSSESFRGVLYRNNHTATTVTVFEMMGTKQGFIVSDSDQAQMRRQADSMMKERAKTDTNMQHRTTYSPASSSSVIYTDETKKIAGYTCKKAYIVTQHLLTKDSLIVWYTPELKFPHVSSTGGTSGFGGGSQSNNSFDKIDGFVMEYARNLPRGRRMEVKVTKIELTDVADKEFAIPKDVEIKSMKEMQQQGGGMFRMLQRP